MALVLNETICLTTPNGTSEVQLLFGDITKLPLEDKMDILFVSAFPDDYIPVPGTLIGALQQNLNLIVGDLALDKEIDLRSSFNCWLSRLLPEHIPYKRIACFERMKRFEELAEQISGMFRAMMPVFNNQDTTVITPLLASGNQGHSEVKVLKSIVSAACHWIKAGLPLRCLKIVIYTRNPYSLSAYEKKLIECFSDLKAKWEDKSYDEASRFKKKYDVCLSYSCGDEELVEKICKSLQRVSSNIIIYNQEFMYNHHEVWQKEIFDIMAQSYKIVAVITPNYLIRSECLEQFNLALCCNRLTGAEVLAPFYVQTVDSLPSYMTLIQYTECRVRKLGEQFEDKIFSACFMLIKSIDKDKAIQGPEPTDADKENTSDEKAKPEIDPESAYDIFISYAHRTPTAANRVYSGLLDINPDLKIFLDRSELRTGNSWQQTLYDGLDKARVFVAFITPSYISSTVCMEEYNIALARYLSMDGIYFLPLLVSEDITEVPAAFSEAPLVDMRYSWAEFQDQPELLTEVLILWLQSLKKNRPILNRFCQAGPRKTRISFITKNWRGQQFDQRFSVSVGKSIKVKQASPSDAPPKLTEAFTKTQAEASSKTVVISHAKSCFKLAMALSHFMQQQEAVSITCEFLSPPVQKGAQVQAPKLQLLDTADMVVVIVSDDYLGLPQHLHELHIALCRQRSSKDQQVLYLMEAKHGVQHPWYAHLLHYNVSVDDEMWDDVAHTIRQSKTTFTVDVSRNESIRINCSRSEHAAVTAAAADIADKLARPQGRDSGQLTNIVNMVSLMDKKQDDITVSEYVLPFSTLKEVSLAPSVPASASKQRIPLSVAKDPSLTENQNRFARTKNNKARTSQSCQIL